MRAECIHLTVVELPFFVIEDNGLGGRIIDA
jgi:hypothetical protein